MVNIQQMKGQVSFSSQPPKALSGQIAQNSGAYQGRRVDFVRIA
jgi:hypothetical protein